MDFMQLLQSVLHFDQHLGNAIAQHGTAIYVILFAIIFVEIGILPLFIAVVRTFAPFVAGVAQMTFARFVTAVTAGAAVWIVTLVGGGYFFGNVPIIHEHMSAIVLVGVGVGVGSLIASGLWRW